MNATLTSRTARFAEDKNGASAVLFAIGLAAMTVATAAAIDYSSAASNHTRLQAATDAAVLAAAEQAGNYASGSAASIAALKAIAQNYVSANGPVGSVVTDFHACTTVGGDCYTLSHKTLKVGQIYVQSTETYTRIFSHLASLSSKPSETITSAATANAAMWPQTITFTMTGAKGWYYKSVNLYVLPTGSSTFTNQPSGVSTAWNWIYQPVGLSTPTTSMKNATTGQYYDFQVGPDAANGMTSLMSASLGAGYGTLTGPTKVTLGQYSDFFLAMSVMNGPCPASAPYLPADWSSNSAYSFPSTGSVAICQATAPATPKTFTAPLSSKSYPFVKEPTGETVCTELENNTTGNAGYSSYNAICNPSSNGTTVYNPWTFMYVNYMPQADNQTLNGYATSVPLTSMFPCSQTAAHQWEDNPVTSATYATAVASATGKSVTPQQDLFYTVSTVCAANSGMSSSGYQTTGGTSGVSALVQ